MMQIRYKRTIQVEEFEPITIEVCRNYDDTDDEGKPINPKEIFADNIKELEALVDTELEVHAHELHGEDASPNIEM